MSDLWEVWVLTDRGWKLDAVKQRDQAVELAQYLDQNDCFYRLNPRHTNTLQDITE